jgi:Ca2+-binding RTX toxin-like protein
VTAAQFAGVTNIEQLRLSAAGNAVTLPNSLVAGTSLSGGVFEVVAGAGVDTVNASGVNNGIKIAFYGSGGNDTFIGGTSDDLFLFTPADATVGNTLIGGTGFDSINLLAGGVVAANAFTNAPASRCWF